MLINSVLGPVDTADLGFTLMHEHIAIIDWCFANAIPGWYDREQTVQRFCDTVEPLKKYGLKTILDATVINLGRDVELQIECARRSGINILACTGIYCHEDPYLEYGVEADYLARLMIREITEGMQGTAARPAYIKCATGNCSTKEVNPSMVQAAALAAKETGLPIYTHTEPGKNMGLIQKEIFEAAGLEQSRIVIGHAYPPPPEKMDYYKRLLDGGTYLGFDILNFLELDELPVMAKLVLELREAGFGKQIMISCDHTIRSDFGSSLRKVHDDPEENPCIRRDCYFSRLFEGFIPEARRQGMTDAMLREHFIDNPRRFFEGK